MGSTLMNPLALWWFILRGVERSFGAAHPAPQLPAAHQPQYITIKDSKRRRHMAVFGNPGTGKSRLFEYMVMQEVGRRLAGKSNRGVIVFDVHGDLYRNLRSRLAVLSLQYPGLDDWLVPVEPLNFFRPGETRMVDGSDRSAEALQDSNANGAG